MAKIEVTVENEIRQLKKDIKNLRTELGWKDAAKEDLLTFEMLEKYPHIVQQQAWLWRWENVDALNTFVDQIPAWVVDDAVMAMWASGEQDLPNSYTGWDSEQKEAGMALMLSRAPSCLGAGEGFQAEKIYSALVVFVHPKQELLTIKEGVESILQFTDEPESDVSIFCELPGHKYGGFYPSIINHAYLVLPYCGSKGKPKQLRLGLTICFNSTLLVCRLHRWEGKHGDLALLPPVFLTDPTLPILLPVGYIGKLWVNATYIMPVPASGTGMVAVRPCISKVTCCHQEVIAGKMLADWTDDEHVVYPSPPTPLSLKDDEADKEDDEDGNRSEHGDEPEDDEKSEHGDGPDEDTMPKKKEDQGSEDESDNQSKTPKVQTASNDSGLGTSGSGDGVGAGAIVRSSGVGVSTGVPLPTQLPSMELL